MDLCVKSNKTHFSDTVFFVKQSEVLRRKKQTSKHKQSQAATNINKQRLAAISDYKSYVTTWSVENSNDV